MTAAEHHHSSRIPIPSSLDIHLQCVVSLDKVDRFFWNDIMYVFTSVLKEGGRRNPQFVRWVIMMYIRKSCIWGPSKKRNAFHSLTSFINFTSRTENIAVYDLKGVSRWVYSIGRCWRRTLETQVFRDAIRPRTFLLQHDVLSTSMSRAGRRSLRTHLKWSKSEIRSCHLFPRLCTACWLSMLRRGLELFGRWRRSWSILAQPPKLKW